MKNFFNGSVETAERPRSFQGDVAARYNYALKFCKGKSVLDVGTGFGVGAEFIARNGAEKVLGIDHNSKLIKQILESNKCKNLSFEYLDVLELYKIDKKFDVILAFEVIEHLPIKRVKEFITLLHDHITSGGVLLLSTPNGLKSQFLGKSLYNPYHTKEYKNDEIKTLLSDYFSGVVVKGYKMINGAYVTTNSEITHHMFQGLVYFLGHFRFVREILAFIPTGIKHLVTKENKLPVLTEKDYIFISKVIDCYGLFAIAKKATIKIRSNPKLSIIIANYNGENYLKGCLDSVLDSDYKNFEVVICDDGSSDSSWKILNDYKGKDKRVRLIRNKKNLGASASRNRATSQVGGKL